MKGRYTRFGLPQRVWLIEKYIKERDVARALYGPIPYLSQIRAPFYRINLHTISHDGI